MKRYWLLIAASALISAPVMACGWALPPFIPLTAPPLGGADPVYDGPDGGGDLVEVVTPEPTETPDAPAPAVTVGPAPRNRALATPGMVSRATASRARPKAAAMPWMRRLAIPWKGVFPVVHQGYDANLSNLGEGLRQSPAEGGYEREETPSLIVAFDSANPDHVATLKKMNGDTRLVAAMHLFNCFKIDVRGQKGEGEIKLSAFACDGSLIGSVKGDRELRRSLLLLEKVWRQESGKDLSSLLPKAAEMVQGVAHCDEYLAHAECGVVCQDCGEYRSDVVVTLEDVKARRARYLEGLASLRKF